MLENLAGTRDFSTLVTAARAAGLGGALNGATPFTLFAPNNAAFNKIPKESIGALINDKAKLGDLLKYHVVPGKISYADLSKMTEIRTLGGKTLPVGRQDGAITVGGAKILGQGIDSRNGMIYTVDNVMTPPGFALPQVSRSTGLPWGWLGLLGLLVLGGLALYMLSRKKKYEALRARYEEPGAKYVEKPVIEETRTKVEEIKKPEETMKQVRESISTFREPMVADIAKNLNLPLSGDALSGLNSMISKGIFKDKPEFLGFLAKTFMANNLGAAMAGGKEPGMSTIMDIIGKTGIAKGFTEGDTKKMLVPLLIAGFMAIYNYINKKPAVKAT